MKKLFRSRKMMKAVVLSMALAVMGFSGAAFAAPGNAIVSGMKNSSVAELTNDTRVFKIDIKNQLLLRLLFNCKMKILILRKSIFLSYNRI